MNSADLCAHLQAQIATLTHERDAAIREMSEHARLRGLAEGKLEGWTARAKAERDRLRSLLVEIRSNRGCGAGHVSLTDLDKIDAALQKEPRL